MLIAIGMMFIVGISLKRIFEWFKLPGLLGLMVTGIILGPMVLNLFPQAFMDVANPLRQIALIIIIFRAGLGLNIKQLIKNKRAVILLSFVPALFEIFAIIILATTFLNLEVLDAAILGCVLAAVSPAVLVPSMLKLIKEKYGAKKGIPDMIMSAASVDDIFVISIFLALITLKTNNTAVDLSVLFKIVSTIVLGIFLGYLSGKVFNVISKYLKLSNIYVALSFLGYFLILTELESILAPILSFSSLLAIMSFGVVIEESVKIQVNHIFDKGWSIFEIVLFVLIGSQLNLNYLGIYSLYLILFIILGALIIRIGGVFVSLIGSPLNQKEKLFVALSYTPKATVQAAIGPIPIAMGISSGSLILTFAIIAILVTAPLGYFLINISYKRLLTQ
ncbi:MAG: hypothetical protein GX760_03080 [Erysipelothrix sp.]|nr:hypothetical protein [Erysipelothrix sp.]